MHLYRRPKHGSLLRGLHEYGRTDVFEDVIQADVTTGLRSLHSALQ